MDIVSTLGNATKLCINGQWVTGGGQQRSIYSPVNEEAVVSVNDASAQDVENAVKAAHEAFANGPWRKFTGKQRRDALLKIAQVLEANKEAMAQVESSQTGKPLLYSRGEVDHVVECFRYYAGFCDKLHGRHTNVDHDTEFTSYTVSEPLGVVGFISSFNFPLMLTTWKLAPALATGNTVVLKPAPQTPLSSLFLAHLIYENGILPEGVFNVVPGALETGVALVDSPLIEKISFTGSVPGGKAVYKSGAASQNFKHITLELGGKSPNVIMDDADIPDASLRTAIAGFFNSGQTCCAGTKLYIHEKVHEAFTQRIVAVAQGFTSKMTTDVATSSLGPLIDKAQLDRVSGFVNRAVESGEAEVLVGGERWGDKGFYYKPTVLREKVHKSEVACQEIFGPVITIMPPFSDIQEVIDAEKDNTFGLASGIFTNNARVIHKYSTEIRAGTVWVNTYNTLLPHMPFGGFKNSGIGRELGHEAINEYLIVKSVISRFP
ncbi:putative aldehyde dehydrogenase-like protein [Zancudomyces culisetae]|uniref:Putative aldehyde dehydrogenase-like protein n=1 Tax=Zancudomyces culisetae TaxID=1213189 RepID=A0A1R1PQW5_ZANCU|nr:putative aldehyde dehydrogenase-like protein [Zancudomyces culisetae]|eukprot:OMH83344.1 putative aldehyde dehydrogenase-like protein [Zancudomyces culisetae]